MPNLEMEGIDIAGATVAAPDIEELTSGIVAGTGIFDKFMQTVKLHLADEYDNNRIVGREYADVYLGALNSVLQQAVVVQMNNRQSKQITAQIGLIRQQTASELGKTSDALVADLGFNETTVISGTLALEKAILTSQQDKLAADITDQSRKITADIALTSGQTAKLITDASDQADKIVSDIDVNDQQILKLQADITDQASKVTADNLLTAAQEAKTGGETLLLGQKTITELAQTCDTLPTLATDPGNTQPWLNNVTTVAGMVAQQKGLYLAQTDGFARDAEQKLAKIMADTWSVRMTSDSATASDTAELDNSSIKDVIDIAKTGIGYTP